LAALLFSTGGAAVKATALGAWQIASFRCGIAALALALLLPRSRRLTDPKIWLVAVTYAATLTLYVLANRLTTAANAIFLQYTAPLYVLLLSPFLLKEKIRRGDVLFMVVLGLGMTSFFLGLEPATATAPNPARGNLPAAGTGLCWGLTLLGLRWVETGGRSGASAAVLAGNILAFVVTLPLALPVEVSTTASDWWVVAYLGVVQIAVAYVFLTRAVGKVRALDVSLLLLLELIFNPVLAWVVHGALPGRWPSVGCGVILGATVIWTLGPAAAKKKRLRGVSRSGSAC